MRIFLVLSIISLSLPTFAKVFGCHQGINAEIYDMTIKFSRPIYIPANASASDIDNFSNIVMKNTAKYNRKVISFPVKSIDGGSYYYAKSANIDYIYAYYGLTENNDIHLYCTPKAALEITQGDGQNVMNDLAVSESEENKEETLVHSELNLEAQAVNI